MQIHAPPTSTVTVSAPITTIASSAITTATMVTPSCGTSRTVGVTRSLFAMQHVPHMILSPEVRAHLNGQGQWEYYSERYVRGVGGVRGGITLPREQPRVGQQQIPQAPRRGTQQKWNTPAQDYDMILAAENTPEDESSDTSSEADSEVTDELERRGRQWRADERARAKDGERRARELADADVRQAELARKKSARKSPESVRVDRTPRMDVRAGHGKVLGQQIENTESDESDWELGRKSKRKERKDKARARDYRDTEEESSASSSEDSARLRRRGYDSRRRADKKAKTRGRDRLAATSSESESERDVRGSRRHHVDDDGIRTGKILRSWNLKFNGKANKKAAEEFLHQLSDCREGNQLSDASMLGALPCVFAGEAATWFRLEKARFSTWKREY